MHFPMSFLEAIPFIGLTLVGALSPLLTFAALFQQKEWRMDRLREHLRRDGWLGQIFGRIRPLFVLCGLIVLGFTTGVAIANVWLVILAALSIVQIALRKQRYPRPTSKAIALVVTTVLLDVLLIDVTGQYSFLYVLTLLQPFVLVIAWLVWKPVDYLLKKRVMDNAMRLRSKMEGVTVIGIAGSVGKTTVKELIAHLLQDLDPAVTPAHVNTEMGVAQWLTKQSTKGSNLFVIEMGAYRKGEIALLCRIAQPTIGVMTALGSDHLALFGSEQNIIDANGELIESLPKDGHAFFYGDNAGCKELAKRAACPVTVAQTGHSTHPPLEGRHNAFNVTLSAAVARYLGIKNERIEELLQTFKPQAHTFNVTNENGVLVLDDTYNISPLSMNAALDWADAVSKRPRVLLTSGLQETGPNEEQYLQDLGTKAATCIERVIFTDKHGADIFAKAFGKPVEILGVDTERVQAGSALLAVGRMPLSRINRLLPTS